MVAILALAALAARFGRLPEGFSGLRSAGPYAVLATAMGLAFWFNRGRSFVIAASILAGWTMYHLFPGRPMYTAVALLVPLNCLLAFLLRERGARHGPAFRWIVLLGAEIVFLVWFGNASRGGGFSDALEHWTLRSPPTPLVGRILFAAAFAAAVWRAYPERKPLQIADAGALVEFFIGCEWERQAFATFMTGAGAMLLVALLQESHRLAFRDELTGLLGRRALQERLRSLGPRYVLAMVDVDHFKKFNDTHGHDVGDQVLKLVAGRLAQVGGGGVAYRYGGEEFSVLFPDRDLKDATRHLEAVRVGIERYRMAVRGEDRPKKNPEDSARLRTNQPPRQTLSVTVSIGVAAPGDAATSPAQVLARADEALYRAKQSGRNRLSS